MIIPEGLGHMPFEEGRFEPIRVEYRRTRRVVPPPQEQTLYSLYPNNGPFAPWLYSGRMVWEH